jgi:hypothetical protein
MRAIETGRTAALGGHRDVCDHCGAERISYHACRNRHCPKCQRLATAGWLDARRAELLPVEYFHVVFTLPHALYALLDRNARLLDALLFRTTAATLSAFAHAPRHLGGELGVTAVLHTWGQTLTQHIHLHCIVTGGALAPDGSRWIPAKPGFLFPVRALAQVFRAQYLEALERAAAAGKLALPDLLSAPGPVHAGLASLRQQDWVVYAKPPFAGPEQVLQSLGRYTHRVALSNDRLIDLQDGVVRFRWKDDNDGPRVKIMALPAEEFIRRFLLHIVPERFVRIRHFGFLANRSRQAQAGALPAAPRPAPASSVPDGGVRSRPPAPPHRHRHRALPGLRPGPPRLGRDTSADPPDPRAGPGHLLMRAVTSEDCPIRPPAGSPSCAHGSSRAPAIIATSPLLASASPPTPSHTLHRGARPTPPCHPSLIPPTPPLR